jgi:hypothetical protein
MAMRRITYSQFTAICALDCPWCLWQLEHEIERTATYLVTDDWEQPEGARGKAEVPAHKLGHSGRKTD